MDNMFDSFITELEDETSISWDNERLLAVPEIRDMIKEAAKELTAIRKLHSQTSFGLDKGSRELLDSIRETDEEMSIVKEKYCLSISKLMAEIQENE